MKRLTKLIGNIKQIYSAAGEVGPCEARLADLACLLQVVVGAFGITELDRMIRGSSDARPSAW